MVAVDAAAKDDFINERLLGDWGEDMVNLQTTNLGGMTIVTTEYRDTILFRMVARQ